MQHDILESLRTGDKAWLVDLLYAFNSGDMKKFDSLKPQWTTQPDLQAHEKALRQKICLMCLMEMTFQVEIAEIFAVGEGGGKVISNRRRS